MINFPANPLPLLSCTSTTVRKHIKSLQSSNTKGEYGRGDYGMKNTMNGGNKFIIRKYPLTFLYCDFIFRGRGEVFIFIS